MSPSAQPQLIAGGKLFTNGTYSTVRGINVISLVQGYWTASIYDFLRKSKVLHRWYSPLPSTSYHITIHPLFTEFELPHILNAPKRWKEVLHYSSPILSSIQGHLLRHPITLKPSFEGLVAGGVLALKMRVSEEDANSVKQVWHLIANSSLNNALEEKRKLISSSGGVVGIHNFETTSISSVLAYELMEAAKGVNSYAFHLTLGYLFGGNTDNLTEIRIVVEELRGLEQLLHEKLCIDATEDEEPKCLIETDIAQACWFNDMTEFKPVETLDNGHIKMFGTVFTLKHGKIGDKSWFDELIFSESAKGTLVFIISISSLVFVLSLVIRCVIKSRHYRTSRRKLQKCDKGEV